MEMNTTTTSISLKKRQELDGRLTWDVFSSTSDDWGSLDEWADEVRSTDFDAGDIGEPTLFEFMWSAGLGEWEAFGLGFLAWANKENNANFPDQHVFAHTKHVWRVFDAGDS